MFQAFVHDYISHMFYEDHDSTPYILNLPRKSKREHLQTLLLLLAAYYRQANHERSDFLLSYIQPSFHIHQELIHHNANNTLT